jgi:uncharacterized protein YcnI
VDNVGTHDDCMNKKKVTLLLSLLFLACLCGCAIIPLAGWKLEVTKDKGYVVDWSLKPQTTSGMLQTSSSQVTNDPSGKPLPQNQGFPDRPRP